MSHSSAHHSFATSSSSPSAPSSFSFSSMSDFDSAASDLVTSALLKCCHSFSWAKKIETRRPYGSFRRLLSTSAAVWFHEMTEVDWLDAFAGHPEIGDLQSLRSKYSSSPNTLTSLPHSSSPYSLPSPPLLSSSSSTDPSASDQWAAEEQKAAAEADEATVLRLQRLNRDYRDKHGFIFIVCATGKSAREMLALVEKRIGNDREEELRNACAQQAEITKLRLQKLIGGVREEEDEGEAQTAGSHRGDASGWVAEEEKGSSRL